MPRQIASYAVVFCGLLAGVDAYTLTAYGSADCTGNVQQTITSTEYGAECLYFNDKAASISVSGADGSEQFIFCNNYPCSADTQVSSFQGNGCATQGATKLKAVTNIIPEGQGDAVVKRDEAGEVKTWLNNDCSGSPTNDEVFANANLPVTLNNVVSIMVNNVPTEDIAFACTDTDCHEEDQVAMLSNGECVNVDGKGVRSAMAIGVPTPARRVRRNRNLVIEARAAEIVRTRQNDITCATDNLANYDDALKVGDDWQGSNGLACCCHIPGGPSCKSDGTAQACLSEDIRCPADPSGTKPPPSTCPMNCNEMRSYVYAIATTCKNSDGQTGGTYNTPGGGITVSHS